MSMDPERDEALSRLYREAVQAEPPPHIDAAVLAAARQAARPAARAPRPWWQRWAIPLSATALALLSASLTLLVSREQEQAAWPPPSAAPTTPSAGAPAARPESAVEGRQQPSAVERADQALPPAPPAPSVLRRDAARPFPPAEKARAEPSSEPSFTPDSRQLPEAEQAVTPLPPPAAPARRAAAAGASAEAESAGSADAVRGQRESVPVPPAPKQEAAPAFRAKSAAPASEVVQDRSVSDPEQWIERIRVLLRQGREAEALRETQALRRAYPGIDLPPDLSRLDPR